MWYVATIATPAHYALWFLTDESMTNFKAGMHWLKGECNLFDLGKALCMSFANNLNIPDEYFDDLSKHELNKTIDWWYQVLKSQPPFELITKPVLTTLERTFVDPNLCDFVALVTLETDDGTKVEFEPRPANVPPFLKSFRPTVSTLLKEAMEDHFDSYSGHLKHGTRQFCKLFAIGNTNVEYCTNDYCAHFAPCRIHA